MSKSIYLINPRPRSPHYHTAEVFAAWGFPAAVQIADAALPTVAALAPADFQLRLCDENVEPVDFEMAADFVGITGKNTQESRMIEISREFRRRRKIVIFGGPHASLAPERLRSECDILVRGEIENIAGQLFSDLRNATWKTEYIGDRPDLSNSPPPRWDLYPNHRAATGVVQTSRGCPFECEFCDVIAYLGRKSRHKSPLQVLAELEQLYKIGYRGVFLADDNLTAWRAKAKELLTAIRDWNDSRPAGRMGFATQLSVDAARDVELVRLAGEAGLSSVFIGLETPNQASLRETLKRQNVGVDIAASVGRFLEHGIRVDAGIMLGFDSDTRDIFEQQYEFAMSLPIPLFMIHPLCAPEGTPLFARMAAEGRLVEIPNQEPFGTTFTNILPRQMSQAELLQGLYWLSNRLYRPEAFGERVLRFIDAFRPASQADAGATAAPSRPVDAEGLYVAGRVLRLGAREEAMVARIHFHIQKNPAATPQVVWMLYEYMQIRHMYQLSGIWDPALGAASRPVLESRVSAG
jgi:radical SAM superfamily enzyme YgiQ (UPF0313 family)